MHIQPASAKQIAVTTSSPDTPATTPGPATRDTFEAAGSDKSAGPGQNATVVFNGLLVFTCGTIGAIVFLGAGLVTGGALPIGIGLASLAAAQLGKSLGIVWIERS